MSRFGERLREARKRARLTQQALADKVEVDDSYISKMETEVDRPPIRKVVLKLAGALGLEEKTAGWRAFLLAAGVLSEEDVEGLELGEEAWKVAPRGMQPANAGTGALGSGVRLGAILARNQNLGFLVEQTVIEAQLTPEQTILAERLILENARSVCDVLAKEQGQERR